MATLVYTDVDGVDRSFSIGHDAVMVNLIGDLWAKGEPNWLPVLQRREARLHLYGKIGPAPGRKMGHVLLLDDDTDRALQTADQLVKSLTPA